MDLQDPYFRMPNSSPVVPFPPGRALGAGALPPQQQAQSAGMSPALLAAMMQGGGGGQPPQPQQMPGASQPQSPSPGMAGMQGGGMQGGGMQGLMQALSQKSGKPSYMLGGM